MLLSEPGEAGAGHEPEPGPAPRPGKLSESSSAAVDQVPGQRLEQTYDLRSALCPGRQLRNLKKLQHLDLSMNSFSQVPDCVVGMPTLEWLDMGGNRLQHLPEDVHR